ncbi:MAG: type II CAAX endopeptidase family protein [Candidatus Baltobacteraceae bacterium]
MILDESLPPAGQWPLRWPAESFRAWPTFAVILAILGGSIVVAIAGFIWIFLAYGLRIRATGVPLVPALLLQLGLDAMWVAVLLWGTPWASRLSLRDLGFRAITPRDLGWAFVAAIAMAIVVNGGALVIEAVTHQKHDQQVVEMFKAVHAPAIIAFFALFAIIIAPIAEEMMFRVFFFNLGLRHFGFWFGAILSGLLFGAAHADLFAFLPLVLGGIILCSVYYRTRNAYASMITHGLFNSLSIFALIFAPSLAK